MTSTAQESTIETAKQLLIDELSSCSSMTGKITNQDVISSYKNVVILEMGSTILALPGALRAPYDLAMASPTATGVELRGIINSIRGVRA